MNLKGVGAGLMKPDKPEDPFANPKGPGAPGGKGMRDGVDKISSGGSKPTTIIINIAKFQDKIEIHTTNFTQGVNDAVAQLEEALTRVVNGVSQGVGNI
ncbi:MAG: hypothetical protein WKG07_01990 [Hymenobacter sp.]